MSHFLDQLQANSDFTLGQAHVCLARLKHQVICMSRTDDTPRLIGLDSFIDRLIETLIVPGHLLVEGNPGLAKTLACKTLAHMFGLGYKRAQFTPDMMPSDLLGRDVLKYEESNAGGPVQSNPKARVVHQWGPVFTNVLLADEINRGSPKLQSALLEAMEERMVTRLGESPIRVRPMSPFDEARFDEARVLRAYGPYFGEEGFDPLTSDGQCFVGMATQNPIEQEGVYPLAEAALDRFLYKTLLNYPNADQLKLIARLAFLTLPELPAHDPEKHVKTLYFFHRLRKMLFNENQLERWKKDPLHEKQVTLIDFTHMRKHDETEGALAQGEVPEKVYQLRATQRTWQESGDRKLVDRARRLTDHLNDKRMPYPEVETGSSPRGLLNLIRATMANALLNGDFEEDVLQPTWKNVRNVVYDVLRHRIRLTSSATAMGGRSEQVLNHLLDWLDDEHQRRHVP